MKVTYVLGLALILQGVAAYLAIRLIRVTGRRTAWLLFASGLALMVVRTTLALAGAFSRPAELDVELVGLCVSAFLAAGTALIGPVFRRVTSAEGALRESEQRYRNLFENARVGIYRTTPGGRILVANPALVTMLGYASFEDLTQRDLEKDGFSAGYDRAAFRTMAERPGGVRGLESAWQRRDGSIIEVRENAVAVRDAEGRVLHYEGTVEDLTEQKELERQLLHAQKMEALGRLAGGVAHDFNNLLTAIVGYGSLLLEQLPEDDPSRRLVDEMVRAGQRASALTAQMLVFARRRVVQPRAVDLNEVVAGMGALLRRVIGEDVELDTRLAPGLGSVRADPGQVEQVLANLAVNARDAMPAGGVLAIGTANVEVDADLAADLVGCRPGPHVMLSVGDTGCGMTPEVLSHLFEPYFTTKEPGKGTGLGLSTVYGIVRQAEGAIRVESEPSKGTTFRIYLPRIDPASLPANPREPVRRPQPGTETILLVEDEEAVRHLARTVLLRHGYRVVTASGGVEALEVAKAVGDDIDLLVTDVVMPGMGGRALAEAVRAVRPGLRVLFVSGYTDLAAGVDEFLRSGEPFLQKPFTPDRLAHAVRDALDAAGPEAPRASPPPTA